MRMRFSLGKAPRHRELFTSLARLFLPISFASVGGISQFLVQIPSTDEILMRYWVAGQVRNITSRIIYNSKFRTGNTILRKFLMIPCEMFLRYHLRNTRIIALLGSGRGRVGDLRDTI